MCGRRGSLRSPLPGLSRPERTTTLEPPPPRKFVLPLSPDFLRGSVSVHALRHGCVSSAVVFLVAPGAWESQFVSPGSGFAAASGGGCWPHGVYPFLSPVTPIRRRIWLASPESETGGMRPDWFEECEVAAASRLYPHAATPPPTGCPDVAFYLQTAWTLTEARWWVAT